MKRTIIATLIAMMLLPMTAMADSYTSLWKKYDAAVGKDHPQTALKVLAQISDKAEKERAYGHLLKAQVASLGWVAQLSRDSIPAMERHLKKSGETAERKGDRVLAAIYQSVMGRMYASYRYAFDDAKELSAECYRRSMAHPEALATAYCTDYLPFVEDGVDSKYYYDDMLHIIGIAAGDYRGMHDYYAAHGKREGACLTALQMVKQAHGNSYATRVKKSKYIMSLDSLASEYSDLVVCGEVAIARYEFMENAEDVTAEEKNNYINYALTKWGAWTRMNILRNAQRRLTLPSVHALLGGEMALPGVPRKVIVLGANNVGEVRLTASRLNITSAEQYDVNRDKDYARLRRHIVTTEAPATDVRRYVGLPAYKTVSDTLEIPGLRSGFYLVELSTDNVSVPVERRILRVCNIYPLIETLPGNRYRVVVLNATTGEAVPGAKVLMNFVKNNAEGEKLEAKHYECDANGEVIVDFGNREPVSYSISTADETAFPVTPINGRFYYNRTHFETTSTTIYTDRRIYRPGQTVHVAAIAYKYYGADQHAEAQKQQTMTLTLRDANRKEVAAKSVTTDEYGMASADFVLPQNGLNGTYTLRSDYGNVQYYNFTVEEYKRPTFGVEIEKAASRYAAGDTVRLAAKAKSFAGVPVQGAKVEVKVVRRPSFFWRCASTDARMETVYSGVAQTDNDGAFTVKVPVIVPEQYDERPNRYFTFDVEAHVTDVSGETQSAETALPYSDRPTLLTCDVPEQTLADDLHTIKFAYLNNAGEPIDGDVTYYIDNDRYTCKANTEVQVDGKSLASMRHRIVAYCGTDTLTQSFVTFTLQDRRAPVETHDWFYVSSRQFKSKSAPVFIQLGSTDSIQHVVYTLIAGDKVIEDGRADLRNEVRTRSITYKEEWGDGITLSVAWVKNGKAYQHTERIERPQPDTHLNIKWTTFRDRLVPGQRETWTLNITNPDGTPAKAQLMATLYDKSLDKLRPHSLQFSLPMYNNVPWLSWRAFYNRNMFVYSEMPMKFLYEPQIDFSHFYDVARYIGRGEVCTASRSDNVKMFAKAAVSGVKEEKLMGSNAAYDSNRNAALENVEAPAESAAGSADAGAEGKAQSTTSTAQTRQNLSETAFFYPGLLTDNKGNVQLQFTLPESVTTWQFYALAHDEAMNNGTLAATSVAKKTVMIQPNVPRFVRQADKGVLSARIFNTSDKQVRGSARLTFLNPETEKEVWHKDVKFAAKAGETAVAKFAFDMSKIANDGLLVCRVTASGRGFSDGEQHYLPVLPDKELVTNSQAFTLNEAGKLDIDLTKLFAVADKKNRLTVEYTNSPEWLMIQALPSMATAEGDNAVSLASAYYANAISRSLMNSSDVIRKTVDLWKTEAKTTENVTSLQSKLEGNAELKQMLLSETPWLMDATREAEQKQMLANYFDESQTAYRLADNFSRLSRLQNADGSFSWWKGMAGSPSMTMGVLTTFARLDKMVGVQPEARSMIDAAFLFMDKYIAQEVKAMKASKDAKNRRPSELAVDYLYAVTLQKRQLKGTAKDNAAYLLKLLAKQTSQFSIYAKSVAAVVLAGNNYAAEARDMVQSLKEYTVYKAPMGRYFDTPKALYSWFDYRIPSQVAAIEALQSVAPADVQTVNEMKQWLLQSKRTQAWDTPVNSVNAVYAFFGGNCESLGASKPMAVLKLNGQTLVMPKATAGMGYVKTAKTGEKMKTLSIEKQTDGTSWGAVYAQFVQPTADVSDVAEGMSVVREVLKNGKRIATDGETLAVGDRITVRIVINADRDYDFVQLADRRAACLEPLGQLSGYRGDCYCEPKDNATNYYFDRLSKGKHVVETEYYVDRAGTYQTGTCTVQCAYSPEFGARTKAVALSVE